MVCAYYLYGGLFIYSEIEVPTKIGIFSNEIKKSVQIYGNFAKIGL